MEGELDFVSHTEPELVEMFGRMDPRYAPEDCARLGKLLAERGYIVTAGEMGPGYAVPSPTKLRSLIGSSQPISASVAFGQGGWFAATRNDLGFVGPGSLTVDGISVSISGRPRTRQGLISFFFRQQLQQVQLPYRTIVNVERQGCLVRFEHQGADIDDGAVTMRFGDENTAERLVAVLPKVRTRKFQPQISANEEFARRLIAQSRTPVTFAIISINILVFIATVMAGADWFRPLGTVQIAWGSNFGPYTTDGEWWRLVTSLFIHFGILHVAANMLALAAIGPLVERLYGSVNYLFIYLLAGVGGSIASIAWHPAINSAGASGAIFGLLGALLAALLLAKLRDVDAIPGDILRPIASWALLFLGWNVYAAVRARGIDYAAHIGGLAAGFLIGLPAVRPVTGERSYRLGDLRRLLQALPVAILVLGAGLWWAQGSAATLTGDSLYWRTAHWWRGGQRSADRRFNEALALLKSGKLSQSALADRVEEEVLPFWRQAHDRLETLTLPPVSPNLPNLELLRELSNGRARAYELIAEGLHKNDVQEISAGEREMKRVDEIARGSLTAR